MIKVQTHIRWMIRRDMDRVLEIEEGNPDAWTEDEYVSSLRQRNCIGMVVEVKEKVVGFMVYYLGKKGLLLDRICVCPWHQRCGLGSMLITKLIAKLSAERRTRIMCEVPLDNLDACLFFKAQGFIGESLEDNILFIRVYDEE